MTQAPLVSMFDRVMSLLIDVRSARKGCWLTCLFTLGCVHSLLFSTFHMDYFLTVRGISVKEVSVVCVLVVAP